MKVLTSFPPMYAEINRRFNVRGKPVIFSWGDTVFNPGRIEIPPALFVHEAVHSKRQGDDPEGWWRNYLKDDEFRLDEEMRAHSAEYGHICLSTEDHRIRQKELHRIAARLASPLYGGVIGYDEARLRIEGIL